MTARYERHGSVAAATLGVLLLASACGGVRSCAPPPLPAGSFLYAVHDPPPGSPAPGADPRIASFRIDPDSGALSAVGGTSLAARAVGAFALDRDPGGRWFLLTGSQLGLQRVGATGALERVDIHAAGLASAFDPRGRYVYVVDGRGLCVYALDARHGPDLAPALHLEAGVLAPALQPSADGATLYALTDEVLRVFSVGASGRLSAAPGTPVSLGMRGIRVLAHPSGRFMIVLGEAGSRRQVGVLRIDSSGAAEPVVGSPFDLGNGLQGVAMAPDGARLFASDDDTGAIATFAFDADGGLHAVASTPIPTRRMATLRTDADGRFLYGTAIDDAQIYGWTIEADGSLAPVPGTPVRLEGDAGDLSTTPRRSGPIQAKVLPAASMFDAAPAHFDVSNPFPADTGVAELAGRLADPSSETRYAAILALGPRQDLELVLPALVDALDDPNAGVRLRARHILGPWALTHPGRVDDAVLDRLVVGPTGRGVPLDNASLCALHALMKRGADASPYLARALVNHGQLRAEAISALVALREEAVPAVPELRRLLGEPQVERHAAYVLGAIGPRAADALPDLEVLLEHPSKPVANAARAAIERIRSMR